MLLSCSVSQSDVCAIGRFTFQPVTLSRGTGPFWDFTSGCHRIDKKDKKKHGGPIKTPYDKLFFKCACACVGETLQQMAKNKYVRGLPLNFVSRGPMGTGWQGPTKTHPSCCANVPAFGVAFARVIGNGKVAKPKITLNACSTYHDVTT